MGGEQALVVQEDKPLDAPQILQQVGLIQSIMKDVMKKDVHFGVIPGTDKPTLLKPGAEKICLTFRLAVGLDVKQTELGNGHREYETRCTLTSPSGRVVGQGIGVCSTMESKFRYRWDSTGKPVPKEYWESRDPALLGGPQYVARKKGQEWLVFQRVEHDNPADYYNTCAKMSKKRAHVDATITATAASDIFAQDVEDLPGREDHSTQTREQFDAGLGGRPIPPASPTQEAPGVVLATDKQVSFMRDQLDRNQKSARDLCAQFGVDEVRLIPKSQVNAALAWIGAK